MGVSISGFDNETIYANNVDFSGSATVTPQVVSDGQLLIGATVAPKIRVGNLTSSNGSIAFALGAGSIDLTVAAANDAILTLTPDTGGAISPTAGNIDILGYDNGSFSLMDTHNTAASTLRIENRTWLSPLVVDASTTVGARGTFSTISAAITAATAGQCIIVRPGTYTENITMKAGVDLFAMEASGYSGQTIIFGTITCTYAGGATISGFYLTQGNANVITVSGANATTLTIKDCRIYANAGAGSHYFIGCSAGSADIKVFNCYGDLGTNSAYFNISAGALKCDDCYFLNNGSSAVVNTITAGVTVRIDNSTIQNRFTVTEAVLIMYNCIVSANTVAATALALVTGALCISFNTIYGSTVAAATVTIDATSRFESIGTTLDVDATTTDTIMTNAGTLSYDMISQRDNGGGPGKGIIPVPTTTAYTSFGCARFRQGQLVNVTTPGAYPYTTLTSDYVILVDTSVARGITLIASPVTGQTYRIKDNVGSAGANNITITPAAGNIDGAASTVININYGSVDIVYNGVQWNVV